MGVSLAVGLAVFAAGAAAKNPNGDQPSPIARGPHISGVVRYRPKPSPAPSAGAQASCSEPGNGNYRTDCNSSGRPVNETWVTYGNGTYYAGANDYNSYNGQGQDGFYSSSDGVNWNDAGPIDVFPHNSNYGAGDPGLAVDSNGVVYYSSLFFSYYSCNVGGVELLRRAQDGSWSYYQIASNSRHAFQDKPAIALDQAHNHVYVSWTQFSSCSGSGTSPIQVAVLPTGASSVGPSQPILSPLGSTYSQGSSIAADGSGGFWIAWEEYGSSSPSIKLAHYNGSTWGSTQTISEPGFKDLKSPLPGFKFRDNSFPALTVTTSGPAVTWTSYDSGVGRAWLWQQGDKSPSMVANTGGDQFFPSIAPDGSGGVYVSYSQVNTGTSSTYDQWLWHGSSATSGSATQVSNASSNPSQDAFFSGQFIGDYNGMVVASGTAHPIWTDIRGPGLNSPYPGWEMDSMFASAASAPSPTPNFSISASALPASVAEGTTTSTKITLQANSSYSGTVKLSASSTPALPSSVLGPLPSSVTLAPNGSDSFSLSINTAGVSAGSYTITVTGTDSIKTSLSDSATVTLTVTSAGGSAGTMTVGVSPGAVTQKGPNYHVPLNVTVEDSSGGSISGATVTLDVYPDDSSLSSGPCSSLGSLAASGSGTTGSSGTVSFNFRTKTAGPWCAVANASDTGYNPATSPLAPFTTG